MFSISDGRDTDNVPEVNPDGAAEALAVRGVLRARCLSCLLI